MNDHTPWPDLTLFSSEDKRFKFEINLLDQTF